MCDSDEKNLKKSNEKEVYNNKKYSLISKQILNQKDKTIWNILNSRKVPNNGLNEITIMSILHQISSQNLCNSEKNIKIGERENRIYSGIVRSKYMGFGHGIGRSGNLDDVQPKSAGNSILAKVTTGFVKDLIKSFGIKSCEDVYILPYATGMCISTCLLYLKKLKKNSKYVIISRIDHKTCYKCIDFCGLKYFVVDMIFKNDELFTDLNKIEKLIEDYKEKICCVISVTSSYAPRNSDDIVKISYLCKKYDVPHLINNAFGLQCSYICKEIQKCFDLKGRVDYVIQSCDKNFLVPVNGGIIFSSNKKNMKALKKTYPGRAPVNAYLDLFITLLELGKNKIMDLREQRLQNFIWLKEQIGIMCSKYNLQLIKNSKNKISMAINLNPLYKYCGTDNPKVINLLGSMLFYRNVTGHRVICSPLLIKRSTLKKTNEKQELEMRYDKDKRENVINNVKSNEKVQISPNQIDNGNDELKLNEETINREICFSSNEENFKKNVNKNTCEQLNEINTIVIGNHVFHNFGSSCDSYPFSYIAFSCVIGIEREEIQNFVSKLDCTINYFINKFKKEKKKKEEIQEKNSNEINQT
ncbi:O-phosphoseryl-tRNA(Sec) selenium transferase, putative [Plasmodium gallinaceum]|uniref:O-phosphoseryl-tRNA(Sec) selenium transferase n=1 Tax=Plasmodium gallinaceum TaxID=5849 RepID=A0A1J1GTW8_PLAGA|nr:O-phosphoseryl-tRNA(Sec) selenium transferase, putative [Plasmodium gallinaceum]CRG95956.1 O-phosphoseryl-tRNA(Sec) selenium transferase, putative [Plasmodium gallinaceum]